MDRLLDYINRQNNIYIYGAGYFGYVVFEYIRMVEQDTKVTAFIVTNKIESSTISSVPVLELSETPKRLTGIIIALSEKYQKETKEALLSLDDDFIYFSDNELALLDRAVNRLSERHIAPASFTEGVKAACTNKWRNILIIKLDGIGDAILSIPFLRELRNNFPDSKITLITTPSIYEFMELCPYIDDVKKWDVKKYINLPLVYLSKAIQEYSGLFLESNDYDAAIVPRFSADWYGAGFFALFSGARDRITFSEHVSVDKEESNIGFDRLYTYVINDPTPKNEADKNLDILRGLGLNILNDGLEIWEEKKAKQRIEELLISNGIKEEKMIVFGLSGSGDHKRWNEKKYLEVIRQIHELNRKFRFAICGDEQNRKVLCSLNYDEGYIVDFSGRISLIETVSLMKRCCLYIGNDTGLMHMASACGLPIIELNCKANPVDDSSEYGNVRFTPWKTPYAIVRPKLNSIKKDGKKEIDYISVEEVFVCTKRMLEKN